MERLCARNVYLFKENVLSWQQLFYKVQADDQKRGEQVSRRFPHTVRCDEQIIDGVEADAGAENAHSAGRCQPTAAKDIRNTEAGKNAAEKMQRPGGDPADQQKIKIGRAVFRQVADVFKGSKAYGDRNGCRRHLFRLRLENQIEKQQRQKLHDFFAYGRDLNGGNCAVHAVLPHEEAADIGAEQAHGHTDGQEQRIAPNAPLNEKHG